MKDASGSGVIIRQNVTKNDGSEQLCLGYLYNEYKGFILYYMW